MAIDSPPNPRIRAANSLPVRPAGDYVLYWMVANRRASWNFALDRAVDLALAYRKPLVILEALRCGYRWASDRLHHFVVQGMADNAAAFASAPVTYYPFVEREPRGGEGLLHALAERACLVVSDDWPCFFVPAMQRAAQRHIPVRFELVDANGMLPMRVADKAFARAFDFRRFLQQRLPQYLDERPRSEPFAKVELPRYSLPAKVTQRWPLADVRKLASDTAYLHVLRIDHATGVVDDLPGGSRAADKQLSTFIKSKLSRYGTERSEPESDAASGLSPWLHFGHISVHQVFAAAMDAAKWSSDKISRKVNGSSKGWWGVDESTEGFVDELITWRELGFNMCSQRGDYDRYDSLPDWAQATLAEHARDKREATYTLDEFAAAKTHDDLWNAAQWQLVTTGRMHNYLRMLWGKKILEWSATPREALATMIELNNKYAIDGRDPNSYSGIFWVLGRYDRPWGPERPIYGKIRYMSSDNTGRKFSVKNYVARYAPPARQPKLFD